MAPRLLTVALLLALLAVQAAAWDTSVLSRLSASDLRYDQHFEAVNSFAVDHANAAHQHAQRSLLEVTSHVDTIQRNFDDLFARQHNELQDVDPAAALKCMQAYVAFNASCALGAAFTTLNAAFAAHSVSAEQLTPICTSPCIQDFAAKLTALKTDCAAVIEYARANQITTTQTGISLDALMQLTGLVNAAKALLCVKNSADAYCLPTFVSMTTRTTWTALTQTDLTTICSECVKNVLDATAALPQISNPAVMGIAKFGFILKPLCAKNGDEFCWLRLQDLNKQFTPAPTVAGQAEETGIPEYMLNQLGNLCHPCLNIVFSALQAGTMAGSTNTQLSSQASALSSSAQYGMKFMCMKNGDRYCLAIMGDLMKSGAAGQFAGAKCPDWGKDPTATCPSTCSDVMRSAASQMGCCVGGLLDMITKMGSAISQVGTDSTGGDVSADKISVMSSKCGVTFVTSCAPKVVKAMITLSNVNATRFADLRFKAALLKALAVDVALKLGVPAENVVVTLATSQSVSAPFIMLRAAVDNSVNLNVVITPTGDAATTETALKTGTLPLQSTMTAGGSALVADPTLGLTVQQMSVTVDTNPNGPANSAAHNLASFFTVLALIVVALLAM